jgi:hypothetical protein
MAVSCYLACIPVSVLCGIGFSMGRVQLEVDKIVAGGGAAVLSER